MKDIRYRYIKIDLIDQKIDMRKIYICNEKNNFVVDLSDGEEWRISKVEARPGDQVQAGDLQDKLRRIFAARSDHILFFDAEADCPYGRAIEVLDLARGGGALTIAVLTESQVTADRP